MLFITHGFIHQNRFSENTLGLMFQLFSPSPIVDKSPRWGKRIAARFPLVFGLSPFAHLLVCSQEATHFAVIVTERPELIELNSTDMDDFATNFLRNKQMRESFFRSSDYEALVKLRGALQPDECFYPVPYPVIGGSGALESYQRGNAWVHLEIYGQTLGL